MKTTIVLLTCLFLIGCQKEPISIPEQHVHKIVNVEVDSVLIFASATLKIQVLYQEIGDTAWEYSYKQPYLVWNNRSTRFSFEVNKPRMAIEIEPSNSPGEIDKAIITIEGKVYRILGGVKYKIIEI